MRPFCFVLMPFGQKRDENGRPIDFDEIYKLIIRPAVERAELEAIRADEEAVGGIIHKPMFERLMLCEYAVADLTSANPNVLYELGIRHGIRPRSTVLVFARGLRLPFDVAPLRGLPYHLNNRGRPSKTAKDVDALANRLFECREPIEDSPLFQLIEDMPRFDVDHRKTDIFREIVAYSKQFRDKLAIARDQGMSAVKAVEASLANVKDADPAIIVDLFLSYRAVSAWQQMVELETKMSPILRRTVLVREQLGLALNRLGRRNEAERILTNIIEEHGESSETNGILGRVYKDQWDDAVKSGNSELAAGLLRKAINTYMAGFDADWRDAYPGVNAVTLMEMEPKIDPRQRAVLPVVRYSVTRRLSSRAPDYWDHATLLELSILENDPIAANEALANTLAFVREKWEPETTSRNIGLIRRVREKRGQDISWIEGIEKALNAAARAE